MGRRYVHRRIDRSYSTCRYIHTFIPGTLKTGDFIRSLLSRVFCPKFPDFLDFLSLLYLLIFVISWFSWFRSYLFIPKKGNLSVPCQISWFRNVFSFSRAFRFYCSSFFKKNRKIRNMNSLRMALNVRNKKRAVLHRSPSKRRSTNMPGDGGLYHRLVKDSESRINMLVVVCDQNHTV